MTRSLILIVLAATTTLAIAAPPRRYIKLDGAQPYEAVGLGYATDLGLYVGGTFTDRLTIGKVVVKSSLADGRHQIFLARFKPDGELDWVRREGGKAPGGMIAMAVAPDGSVAMTGEYQTTASNGPANLGRLEAFVMVIGPDGKPRWEQRIAGDDRQRAGGVAFDRDGSVLVCGSFSGTTDFGGQALTSVPLGGPRKTPAPSTDVFVARYSALGKLAWVTSAGGPNDDGAELVTTNLAGDVIIAGEIERDARFGDPAHPVVLKGPPKSSHLLNPNRIFVAAYSSTGQFRWATQYGSRDTVMSHALAPLADGSLLVHGDESDAQSQATRGFVIQLDGSGAQLQDRETGALVATAVDEALVSVRLDGATLVFERHTASSSKPDAPALALTAKQQPLLPMALARGHDGRVAFAGQSGKETEKELGNRRVEVSYDAMDVFVTIAPASDKLRLR